jgi:hypothetical protein
LQNTVHHMFRLSGPKEELVWRIPVAVLSVACLIVIPAIDVIKTKLSVQVNGVASPLPMTTEPPAEEYSVIDVVG